MAETRYFICQGAQHNKFWKYVIEGSTVTYSHGRIGGHTTVDSKTYGTPIEAKREANKKANKKMKPGSSKVPYTESTEERLGEETQVADALGNRHKIQELHFIEDRSKNKIKLTKNAGYDSDQGVLVKIMDSWSKEEFYLIVAKGYDRQFSICSVTKNGLMASVSKPTYAKSNFVQGIRTALMQMQKVVMEALGAVTFAAVGLREIEVDGNMAATAQLTMDRVIDDLAISAPAISSQVIGQFASLGDRMLEI